MGSEAACSIELPDQPMDCCFSSTDHIVASALVNGQILLHRYTAQEQQPDPKPDSGSEHQQDATESSSSIAYSATQLLCRDSKKGSSCRAVTFSSDSSHLFAGFETGSILQLDTATGKVKTRLTKAHAAQINRLLGIPEQPQLVAAGDESGGLCIWDARSQSPVMKYSKHTDFISGLTVTEKQQALLAVSGDGTLSVHDLRSNKAVARSEDDADDELMSVAVVKHGKKVVCGSQSGVLAIWSWGYWNDCSDRFPGHPESVDALVKFDEDTIITGSSDGALRVINVLPNKLIGVIGEHEEDMPVERLAIAFDRSVLCSMSHDSVIKLWDLSILQEDDGEGGDDADDEQQQQQESQAEAAAMPAGTGASSGQQADDAAAAVAAGGGSSSRRRRRSDAGSDSDNSDDGVGADSDGDDSDSDDEEVGKKKRKKHEKTAMSKGRNKQNKAGNFFADLL